MIWAFSLLSKKLISLRLTPILGFPGIRSLIWFGRLTPPTQFSALPPVIIYEASPKAISGRTSYICVRLEFLRYPQLIPQLFNGGGFGPPQDFTPASTCSWIGHTVSGLLQHTIRSIKTRFPFGSVPCKHLTSHVTVSRRSVLQKVQGRIAASFACIHTVSGSFSLPSRGSFHLSLTVLVLYRSLGSI